MALNWDWNSKIGSMTVIQTVRTGEPEEHEISLYQGNAFLIMLNEWTENEENMWSMFCFFADKDHAKNCLGLNKKDPDAYNMLDANFTKATKFRLSKSYRYLKDLVPLLVQAFDNITIEIYSEE